MKISELIAQLEQIKEEHGDLRVTTYNISGMGVRDYDCVRIKHIREKRKRETISYYAFSDEQSIEKVCHV